MKKGKPTETQTIDTNSSCNIEISLLNSLTVQQISSLKKLAAPYDGVIVTADKLTFPNLLQGDGSSGADRADSTDSAELCSIAVNLVN